jgi:hypothetical protein
VKLLATLVLLTGCAGSFGWCKRVSRDYREAMFRANNSLAQSTECRASGVGLATRGRGRIAASAAFENSSCTTSDERTDAAIAAMRYRDKFYDQGCQGYVK